MPARDHDQPARRCGGLRFSLRPFAATGALPPLLLRLRRCAHREGGQAQAPAAIYTCTDARGRTLTADRPIAECTDREQRELNPSGSTRRKIEPTYTARELAEREDRAREASIQAARLTDERRRERALLVRYPNATVHDRERKPRRWCRSMR
jgi:hypothetical protein